MDGARNFNSVIHFTRIPWTIRSEKDENMKYFTKRSLKFFSRYCLSMVRIPAAIYKYMVTVELSRNKFTHGYLGSFSACAWKQPRKEAKYSLFIQNDLWYWITTNAISCWWHQTNWIKLRVVFHNERTSHLVINDQQLQPSFNFNVKSEQLMLY